MNLLCQYHFFSSTYVLCQTLCNYLYSRVSVEQKHYIVFLKWRRKHNLVCVARDINDFSTFLVLQRVTMFNCFWRKVCIKSHEEFHLFFRVKQDNVKLHCLSTVWRSLYSDSQLNEKQLFAFCKTKSSNIIHLEYYTKRTQNKATNPVSSSYFM